VVVPRTRFAPVKTTSDLFVLRSDVYTITPAATVEATVAAVSEHCLWLGAFCLSAVAVMCTPSRQQQHQRRPLVNQSDYSNPHHMNM
jgi:hypothetical protein